MFRDNMSPHAMLKKVMKFRGPAVNMFKVIIKTEGDGAVLKAIVSYQQVTV